MHTIDAAISQALDSLCRSLPAAPVRGRHSRQPQSQPLPGRPRFLLTPDDIDRVVSFVRASLTDI